MKLKKWCLLLITVVLLVQPVNVYAEDGVAKIFYFKGDGCLGPGTTFSIKSNLSGMEYTSVRKKNASRSTVLAAFGNSKVIHILTHGAAGKICIGAASNKSYITYSNLSSKYSSLSSLKFVFLESCSVASTNKFQNTLKSLGVQSSLAFKDTISASTDSNGIHYFAKQVYCYLAINNSVSYSALRARIDTYNKYGKYWGSNSYSVYGGSLTLM